MKPDNVINDAFQGVCCLCLFGCFAGFSVFCSILDASIIGIIGSSLVLITIIVISIHIIINIKKRRIKYYSDLLKQYDEVLQNYDKLIGSDYKLQPKDHYEQNCRKCKAMLFEITAKGEDLKKLEEHKIKQKNLMNYKRSLL